MIFANEIGHTLIQASEEIFGQILFGPQTVFASYGCGSIDKFTGTERSLGSLERTQQQIEWWVLFGQKYNQPLETLRMIRKWHDYKHHEVVLYSSVGRELGT